MKFALTCCAIANVVASEVVHNYDAVRADILDAMTDPTWDDGTYAPIFVRLAWHSSGTYDAQSGTGGSNGATMRYALEGNDPQNAGLNFARDLLAPIKKSHSWISYSDLWILASYVALEATGGPVIKFRGGRQDAPESKAIAPGRMPNPEYGLDPGMNVDSENRLKGWENTAQHIRDVFGRMGLSEEEAVALISGGHAYGRCHREYTGYEGTWMNNAIQFNNEYVTDLIGDEWVPVTGDTKLATGAFTPDDLRPSPDKRQYIDLTTIDPTVPGFFQAGMRGDDHKVVVNGTTFSPGKFQVSTIWINVRQGPESQSPILVRLPEESTLDIIGFIHDDEGRTRGVAVHGGWVSIVTDGGSQYLEPVIEDDAAWTSSLSGVYRLIQPYYTAPIYKSASLTGNKIGQIPAGSNFECKAMQYESDNLFCQLATDNWALVYSVEQGLIAEKIVHNWNDDASRKPQKDQFGHQMMLVSDMVLRWDKSFRDLMEPYNTDDDSGVGVLREDFGKAFKKLTELGCPWTRETIV